MINEALEKVHSYLSESEKHVDLLTEKCKPILMERQTKTCTLQSLEKKSETELPSPIRSSVSELRVRIDSLNDKIMNLIDSVDLS